MEMKKLGCNDEWDLPKDCCFPLLEILADVTSHVSLL